MPSEKLKIAINGYFLSRPFTGFGVYTRAFVGALAKQASRKDFEILVFVPQKPVWQVPKEFKLVVIPEPKTFGAGVGKLWWEQVLLPREAKKRRIALMHHFYPATAVFNRGIKQLTSIHDATPWHFAKHNQGFKIKLFRKFTVWSNTKADRIISVSQYGKNDVADIFGISKEKIDYIYNGVDPAFRVEVTPAGKDAIRKKYNLPPKYIFYIGGFEVHKNVRKMVGGFARAASEIPHHLVIAGGVFSKTRLDVYRDYFDLPAIIKSFRLENRVSMIGTVPERDLPALYQSAELFLMLSLAEGFNLPMVQAFASQTPVVAAKTPASYEIAQNGAFLVDAQSAEAIAFAIVKTLTDSKLRRDLIAQGFARQRQFNWEDSARRLLEIYRKLV